MTVLHPRTEAVPTAPAPSPASPGRVRARRRDAAAGLFFVLPMLVLFVLFRFVPTLGTVGLSLTDYQLSGEYSFVGAENYQRLWESPVFGKALTTTVIYAAVHVPLMLVVALGTALLLNRVRWGSSFFRGSLFMPYVTSFVLAGLIWTWVLKRDGLVNGLAAKVGAGPFPFLDGEQVVVLTSLAVVSVWRGFGYAMLILLAGLKTIPQEVREAALLDRTTSWQRLRHVTIPMLRRPLFFVLVIETIISFQVFDTIYVMTGGGPARASYSLVYALYEQGFRFFDFGFASTIGVVLFLIVLAISLLQRRVLEREDAR